MSNTTVSRIFRVGPADSNPFSAGSTPQPLYPNRCTMYSCPLQSPPPFSWVYLFMHNELSFSSLNFSLQTGQVMSTPQDFSKKPTPQAHVMHVLLTAIGRRRAFLEMSQFCTWRNVQSFFCANYTLCHIWIQDLTI